MAEDLEMRQSLALELYNVIRGQLILKSYPGNIPDRLWDDEITMSLIIQRRMCGEVDYGEDVVQILRRYYMETEEEKLEEEKLALEGVNELDELSEEELEWIQNEYEPFR